MIIKNFLILLLAANIGFTLNVQAQKTTKFGDDVSTLTGIMKAYYATTSVKKGELASYERDSLLHFPGAMVGLAGVDKNGKPMMNTMTIKQFHEQEDTVMAKTGFNERQIYCKIEKFGNLYHVWSTYETRYIANGPIIGRGIDSVQLFYDGTRFWILGWFDDVERKDKFLPKEYLPH
ncbi:hypothetical protein [Mucilaginibacter polytrichastri]|uniref:SnoaL-like domain-containing protein n=1 Tax=Mucilaginibacter polytrichastri TaxID=1302689 RepID=A0A1Q5ZY09_9SPHI|nr:hypothetical protein [Mucilaginibacter polytrichastri]OKS86646.1 hypothetical protein RG47T_2102 [Mucilaginibacter polytrichastri]SFS81548.1 hypothetical protein SAMN04487890_104212 [Mucilaginibacter polytrichastri]